MDVIALRTEIKAWERDFKADNGRDPTIQDIKDRTDIGAVLIIGTLGAADHSHFTQLRSTSYTRS